MGYNFLFSTINNTKKLKNWKSWRNEVQVMFLEKSLFVVLTKILFILYEFHYSTH